MFWRIQRSVIRWWCCVHFVSIKAVDVNNAKTIFVTYYHVSKVKKTIISKRLSYIFNTNVLSSHEVLFFSLHRSHSSHFMEIIKVLFSSNIKIFSFYLRYLVFCVFWTWNYSSNIWHFLNLISSKFQKWWFCRTELNVTFNYILVCGKIVKIQFQYHWSLFFTSVASKARRNIFNILYW